MWMWRFWEIFDEKVFLIQKDEEGKKKKRNALISRKSNVAYRPVELSRRKMLKK